MNFWTSLNVKNKKNGKKNKTHTHTHTHTHTVWINAKEQREGAKMCVCFKCGASSLPSPVALNCLRATTVHHRVFNVPVLFTRQSCPETKYHQVFFVFFFSVFFWPLAFYWQSSWRHGRKQAEREGEGHAAKGPRPGPKPGAAAARTKPPHMGRPLHPPRQIVPLSSGFNHYYTRLGLHNISSLDADSFYTSYIGSLNSLGAFLLTYFLSVWSFKTKLQLIFWFNQSVV